MTRRDAALWFRNPDEHVAFVDALKVELARERVDVSTSKLDVVVDETFKSLAKHPEGEDAS